MSLIQKTELIITLAKAEFKIKNRESILGIVWYLLNPLFSFMILFFVFSTRLGENIENYAAYLLIGLIVFGFFNKATTDTSSKILQNTGFIKSINFPKEVLISSAVLNTVFSHIFEIIIAAIILIFLDINIYGFFLYLIPLIFLALFSYGISLILASISLYIIDIENIWLFASRLLWLATPIFYSIEAGTKLFMLNLFNPLYYFITVSRYTILELKMPPFPITLMMILYTLLALGLGVFVFDKLKKKFAERI